jgi:hypothetical protein
MWRCPRRCAAAQRGGRVQFLVFLPRRRTHAGEMLVAGSVLTLAFVLGPPVGAIARLSGNTFARPRNHSAILSVEPGTAITEVDCVGPECDVDEAPAVLEPPPNGAGGKTIDMRRGRTGEVGSSPSEQRSYGVDPRERTGKPELEASEIANALAEEPHASASALDIIRPLRSVEELIAALAKAGSQRLVVIKFYARCAVPRMWQSASRCTRICFLLRGQGSCL